MYYLIPRTKGSSISLKLLLELGANPNAISPEGSHPLEIAVSSLNAEAVKILLAGGANMV